MTFEELFSTVTSRFKSADISSLPDFLAIQITITGTEEESGIFYVEIKDGVLAIEPYNYYDNQVAITISSENFTKLLNKKLDPVIAYTTGKLKAHGDVGKALELKKFLAAGK